MQEQKKSRKLLKIIIAACAITAALGTAVYLFSNRVDRSMDYAPKKVDEAAEEMEASGEKLTAPEGGGAVSLTYSTDVFLDFQAEKAEILFENPSKSTQDMVLQLFIKSENEEEELLAQSELIPTGYRLEELSTETDLPLSSGKYEGIFRVLYYDMNTGEKAMVDTEIPIQITVEHGAQSTL